MHLLLCIGHRVTLSHSHFETSVLFSKVIWNTVSLFITTISIITTLCIKTTININTTIIIAIITTSIYFITAISFVLTINTIYIIITTIITTTLSFIIIIIISIKAKKFSLLLLSLWVQWHFSTSASCNLTSFASQKPVKTFLSCFFICFYLCQVFKISWVIIQLGSAYLLICCYDLSLFYGLQLSLKWNARDTSLAWSFASLLWKKVWWISKLHVTYLILYCDSDTLFSTCFLFS